MKAPFGRAQSELVLLVHEATPQRALLTDALEESGYAVLVAADGETALQRAAQAGPDLVLLDATLPGLDGFGLSRALRAGERTGHVPLIFLVAEGGTETLLAAIDAGAVDCVAKPVPVRELLARIGVHLQGARCARQARHALDAFGYASIAVRPGDGRLLWQTPLARELLARYYGTTAPETPPDIVQWLRRNLRDAQRAIEPPGLVAERNGRRLSIRLHQQTGDSGDWLIVMREVSDAALIEAMGLALRLTQREAEVLYWVIKGKINRDIGDILGASPATVKKHLERVFAKLGVETRTAAAGMAMNRIRQLHPQFEG